MSIELDWAQKYRPKCINEVILSDELKKQLGSYIRHGAGMSLLFWGRPGCGKTTVAKLIDPDKTILVNCSSSNSIETVRWIEEEFDTGMVYGNRRIILLDEADNLTTEAQAALRGVAEKLSKFNSFILTANDPNKLSAAIRSRFLPIDFNIDENEEMKELVIDRISYIRKSEGLKALDNGLLRAYVAKFFPDIRRIIKTVQFNSMKEVN